MTFAKVQNISTLDPSRLVASDFIQLGAQWFIGVRYRHISVIYCRYNKRLRYPPETRGFLYLHRPYGVHPCAATLRFRICDEGLSSQKSFARGKDLLSPKGVPWEVTIFRLFMPDKGRNLREGLVLDKVLSLEAIQQVDNLLNNRAEEGKTKNILPLNLVFSFGQTFRVSMKQQWTSVNFVNLKTGKLQRVEIRTKMVGKFF
jgi:hypothetical protein